LVNRLVKYCVGLTFVACLSAAVVYAVHGWSWQSKFGGGLTVSLPEFVAVVVLVTLVLGVCVEYWRTKQVVR
jgi:F0F1-type ATP synthase assembly protein I